jgi:hypothetical protein
VFSTRRTLLVIDVRAVSPENEMRVAERLRQMIVRAWPDVAKSRDDRVDLLVGIRSPAQVDILVVVDLERPRELPPMPRRDGSRSPAAQMQHALIAIEVKQLDANRLECFPSGSRHRRRSRLRSETSRDYKAGSSFEREARFRGFRRTGVTEADEASAGSSGLLRSVKNSSAVPRAALMQRSRTGWSLRGSSKSCSTVKSTKPRSG